MCRPDGTIVGTDAQGFFARDTRLVSTYGVSLNGRPPVLLASSTTASYAAHFESTNEALRDGAGVIAARTLSLRLQRTIAGGVHEDYDLMNYGRRPVELTIELEIHSDFADIFEVKVGTGDRAGSVDTRWIEALRELRTAYLNRSFRRELIVAVEQSGSEPHYANGRLVFAAHIAPKGTWHTCVLWLPVGRSGERGATLACDGRPARVAAQHQVPSRPTLDTPNLPVRRAWDQSVEDLEGLRLEDPEGGRGFVIPAAGSPWFLTLFGRDSLIVSGQTLGVFPEFAVGSLSRLSELQATTDDAERDMEPGKIPHEIRNGELAELGLLPFQPYYGTHDATSLFVIAVSQLFDWSGDVALLRRHVPNADAAMAWIDGRGDRDADGFQEYATRSAHGYYNQGWKDAGDAIPGSDGSLAPLPLALCELQGYAYDAKLRLARMYDVLDRPEDAARMRSDAGELYARFNDAFWWEAEGTYYLGLDGRKRPIATVASNAGHLLASGIVPADRAGQLARRLLADDMWSGWGVRTLSSTHPAYDPFSYHTGSVWPHDNAILVEGLRRYGLDAEAAIVSRGIFDAAEQFRPNRVPELFAGLAREHSPFPVQYPGANVPQAWAASAILHLVTTLCGIRPRTDGGGSRIELGPALPPWLPEVTLRGLRVGRGKLSARFADRRAEIIDDTTGFPIVHAARSDRH